ncbi:hypothetical protein CR162_04535 [Pseudoroseomonas rhizosphaerae]|uniref:Uncharacterized protein n=1 Tax=Teichococcus rhizosphaerae TaxID=1335062 RepID=A0A2C7AEM5_9PROT|nr:hypothetical protein [Pseudoroseomonas rhizosphaerae]PHK96113.1 hypothetical protein CR162_04535 [Pseudoroseomonas rhizosphaerae]
MATHGLPTWPWTNAHVDALPAPEALLLEGIRRWSCAERRGLPGLPEARLPFIAENVAPAAPALDAVMRLGGQRFLAGETVHPALVGNEPALLLAFALAQRGPRREALAAFLRLLQPAGAYAAMGPAIGLALSFRRAGLLLANPLR